MILPKVVLKPGKEKSISKHHHPWIFSGAIEVMPLIEPGQLADVYDSQGSFIARGYFHPDNSIAGRILSFSQQPIDLILDQKIDQALQIRRSFLKEDTNCYRLINAEGDGISGLIVDVYHDVVVIQCSTWGIERVKPTIVTLLAEKLRPKLIYEKSLSSSRSQEGLSPVEGVCFGEMVEEVSVCENGIEFVVSLTDSQKTGLFLDHRMMREYIGSLAKNKKVLNCFSYTGGFSLYALKGGASLVKSVDISESASLQNRRNTEKNGFSTLSHTILCEDVFTYLSNLSEIDADIVIIDPPAFAKKRKDIESAVVGYRRLNSLVLSKVKKGTLVLTSSCSYFMDKESFQHIIFQAASECRTDVRILQHHMLALDHPISLYHREGEYLKSLVLYVL